MASSWVRDYCPVLVNRVIRQNDRVVWIGGVRYNGDALSSTSECQKQASRTEEYAYKICSNFRQAKPQSCNNAKTERQQTNKYITLMTDDRKVMHGSSLS